MRAMFGLVALLAAGPAFAQGPIEQPPLDADRLHALQVRDVAASPSQAFAAARNALETQGYDVRRADAASGRIRAVCAAPVRTSDAGMARHFESDVVTVTILPAALGSRVHVEAVHRYQFNFRGRNQWSRDTRITDAARYDALFARLSDR